MAIKNLDLDRFSQILRHQLSPSGPIDSYEHLHGRHEQLRQIAQAFNSVGRQIFIYGDRGVGKTSLAHTAALRHQSAENNPIVLSCDKSTTLFGLLEHIADNFIDRYKLQSYSTKISGGVTPKNGVSLSAEKENIYERDKFTPLRDINTAIQLIKSLGASYSKDTIVIIDEFDLIEDHEEKIRFANFIKQLGDQKVNVQFVFCGIAESLDDLLAGHNSAYRYIESIKLLRLGWEGRFEIIDSSAQALGVGVNKSIRYRIAAISDGFPYFVHLLCEKLYWELYDDTELCEYAERQHYLRAVIEATRGIQQQLKTEYDKATMKNTNSNDYHELLWAIADHQDHLRKYDDIYESYTRIVETLGNTPLPRDKFSARLNSLKSNACGNIIISKRKFWYEFKNNILRGYVRLRAEEQGVELELSYAPAKIKQGQTMRVPTKADVSIYKGRFGRYHK